MRKIILILLFCVSVDAQQVDVEWFDNIVVVTIDGEEYKFKVKKKDITREKVDRIIDQVFKKLNGIKIKGPTLIVEVNDGR